jgi:phosphatidylglycerophosphatase A
MIERLHAGLLRQPVHLLALGFGAGLSSRAPGTVGTLVAIPLVLLVAPHGWVVHAAVAAGCFAVGCYLCGESARRLGVHDHPGIVWDEITGYLITMLAAPAEWPWLLAGFVLFRLFDIWKPWPIREADHSLRGGLGIMLDDAVAAVYAGVLLYGLKSGF